MMAIGITMLNYLVNLVPASFKQAGDYVPFSVTDNLIHIITPCLLIIDWLLFVPRNSFRWVGPLLCALVAFGCADVVIDKALARLAPAASSGAAA